MEPFCAEHVRVCACSCPAVAGNYADFIAFRSQQKAAAAGGDAGGEAAQLQLQQQQQLRKLAIHRASTSTHMYCRPSLRTKCSRFQLAAAASCACMLRSKVLRERLHVQGCQAVHALLQDFDMFASAEFICLANSASVLWRAC